MSKKSSGESLHMELSQISDTKVDSKTSSKTTSKTVNKDVQNDETCTVLEDNSVIYNIKKTFTVKILLQKRMNYDLGIKHKDLNLKVMLMNHISQLALSII